MHRQNLIEAAAQAALRCGLCLHTGYEHQMNEALKTTPALWLAQLESVKTEGHHDGIKTYAMKMVIIDIPDRQSALNQEIAWQQMESKASEICSYMAQAECVKSISNIEFTAGRNSITNRGEVSMSIKMNVHVPFFINNK